MREVRRGSIRVRSAGALLLTALVAVACTRSDPSARQDPPTVSTEAGIETAASASASSSSVVSEEQCSKLLTMAEAKLDAIQAKHMACATDLDCVLVRSPCHRGCGRALAKSGATAYQVAVGECTVETRGCPMPDAECIPQEALCVEGACTANHKGRPRPVKATPCSPSIPGCPLCPCPGKKA